MEEIARAEGLKLLLAAGAFPTFPTYDLFRGMDLWVFQGCGLFRLYFNGRIVIVLSVNSLERLIQSVEQWDEEIQGGTP